MGSDFDMHTFLIQLAQLLGWESLTLHEHDVKPPDVARSEKLVWYESGSFDDMLLQINTNPSLHGGVYATRYRICTGWHAIGALASEADVELEASRLEPWLAHHWFTSPAERRRFRLLHPECAGYTLKRLREQGPPHQFEPRST